MGVIGFKIFRDLWGNKGRTFQVVLIIALGAAAIGMILGTRNLVIPGMESQWQSIHPAMINIFISPSINDDDLISLKKEDGVVDIEGSGNTTVEWRVNPTDEWKSGALTFRTDYSHQELNVLERIEGNWPAGKTISIGQGDDSYFKIPKNGTIYLRYNDKIFTLHTGGVVYNMATQPAYFGGSAQFYIDRDEYENIINDRNFNLVLVTGAQYDVKKTAELGDNLQKQIERMGSDSGRQINDPKKHPFQDSLDGVFFLLGVLGAFALILGLLLVYNTINAIISQQVDQIGIMKAIGARTGHILRLYLTSILIYSLFAVLVAIPLGTLGAWAISNWLVGSFGASTGPFEYSPPAVWIMIAIIFLAPMLAALIPIFSGARITVREAISTYGLRTTTGLIERLLAKVRAISRMLLLTISNTFRNKGRVTLLQISLVLSGLIFMMVISVQDSVVYTVRDILFSILNANITFLFDDPYRINYIEDVTLSYPGVKAVEMWGFGGGKIRPMGKPESEDDKSASLMGVPLPTQTYGYQLRGGRWLDPSDSRAIVLNTKLAKDVGVGVGDWVTVKYGEKNEANWRVVGLVFDPVLTTFALVPREALGIDQGSVGRAQSAWILTDKGDLETEVSMAKGLRAYYKKLGVKVNAQPGIFGLGGDSTTQTANTLINQFNFLVILLGIMAVIIGAVGSIALSGALSLSVIERRREIGVMRAIGASSWTIARLFIGEGLIQGWLSWLIALPISLPAGKFMVQALGQAFQIDIVYKFTPMGAILWFGIITILSIIASWLPARGATHISVRESLAYQ